MADPSRKFKYPFSFYRIPIRTDDNTSKLVANRMQGGKLTMRAINKMMDYPDFCNKRRDLMGKESAYKRAVKWLDSVESKLDATLSEGYPLWYPPEFDHCTNPDRIGFDQTFVSLDFNDDERRENTALVQQCTYQIETFTDVWEQRSVFSKHEKISVKVLITN